MSMSIPGLVEGLSCRYDSDCPDSRICYNSSGLVMWRPIPEMESFCACQVSILSSTLGGGSSALGCSNTRMAGFLVFELVVAVVLGLVLLVRTLFDVGKLIFERDGRSSYLNGMIPVYHLLLVVSAVSLLLHAAFDLYGIYHPLEFDIILDFANSFDQKYIPVTNPEEFEGEEFRKVEKYQLAKMGTSLVLILTSSVLCMTVAASWHYLQQRTTRYGGNRHRSRTMSMGSTSNIFSFDSFRSIGSPVRFRSRGSSIMNSSAKDLQTKLVVMVIAFSLLLVILLVFSQLLFGMVASNIVAIVLHVIILSFFVSQGFKMSSLVSNIVRKLKKSTSTFKLDSSTVEGAHVCEVGSGEGITSPKRSLQRIVENDALVFTTGAQQRSLKSGGGADPLMGNDSDEKLNASGGSSHSNSPPGSFTAAPAGASGASSKSANTTTANTTTQTQTQTPTMSFSLDSPSSPTHLLKHSNSGDIGGIGSNTPLMPSPGYRQSFINMVKRSPGPFPMSKKPSAQNVADASEMDFSSALSRIQTVSFRVSVALSLVIILYVIFAVMAGFPDHAFSPPIVLSLQPILWRAHVILYACILFSIESYTRSALKEMMGPVTKTRKARNRAAAGNNNNSKNNGYAEETRSLREDKIDASQVSAPPVIILKDEPRAEVVDIDEIGLEIFDRNNKNHPQPVGFENEIDTDEGDNHSPRDCRVSNADEEQKSNIAGVEILSINQT